MKIAVFPCGTEIGLEIGRSLRFDKNIELFGLSSIDCHGKFIYDRYYTNLPFVNDPMFFVYLGEFKREYGIDLVIPANDITLEYFALNEQPTYHDHKTIMTCSRKSRTYKTLKDVVRTPEQYTVDSHPYECFLKPDEGHSGINCHHITSDAQFTANYNGQLIMEYLEGEEFTVDCFTQGSKLIYAHPRTRENIRTGISAVSETAHKDYPFLVDNASRINDALTFNGAWFCQFKKAKGELVLMEVAARIGGSTGINRANGINLPLADIYNYMGSEVELSLLGDAKISRSLSVRAELPEVEDIYIDIDDTLILNNRVNWQVMAFIYKYRNEVNIHLLTRNKDPYSVLDSHGLRCDLFKSICIAKSDQRKADYVKGGMLVDDSWSERQGCFGVDLHSLDLYL